LLIR
jgi:hypothetical protein